jgi:DNA-binding CsgD family transcriptional regulator
MQEFKYILCIICVAMAAFIASAQEIPLIKNHQPEIMQAANQNWSVTQAPSRFIYVANTAGLVQYDGARWKLMPLPNRQIVRAIAADEKGHVFCGGFGEFGFWKADALGVMQYTSLSKGVQSGRIDTEEIWHILIAGGKVYFQSFSAMYRYDYQSVQEVLLPGNIMFMQKTGSRVLLPAIGQGVFQKLGNDSFQLLPGSEQLQDHIVVGMATLPGGELLIGTDRQGLFLLRDGLLRPWNSPVQKAMSKTRLNKMYSLSDGSIAFGTVGGGLFISDSEGRVIHHIYKERGLQNNTVLSLYQDQDGNLWAGLDRGLDLLVMSAPLRFSIDRSGNLGAVYTACEFQNKLYLGTNQGLFYKHLQPTPYDLWTPVAGIKGQVWELVEVNGQLLCGHNDGTFIIENGAARKISGVTGGWTTQRCPWDSTRWIQGTYTGLIVLKKNPDNGQLIFSHRMNGFGEPVEFMAFDDNGNLWAAHPYKGLHRLSINRDLTAVTKVRSMSEAEGLGPEFNLSLARIFGKVVLHSARGFYSWDDASRQWQVYALPGWSTNGAEKAIIPAGENAFFVIYPDRVIHIEKGRQTVFNLRLVDDRPNIIAMGDQVWLFCLEDGYAKWDARKATEIAQADIRPRITEMLIAGRKGASANIGILSAGDAEIVLQSYENHLIIQFASFIFDRKPMYRWRLKGLNEEWSEWQENSSQEFGFMPTGNYRFEVQSDHSEAIAGIDFRINPRWHQTWYMRFLFVLAATAAGLAALIVYRRRIVRQHRRMLLERERELHQQRIQERNNQLQEDVLKKAKDLANSTMHLIKKNEVLLEIRQRLTDLPRDARSGSQLQQLHRLVERELSSENDWEVFEENFNSVHEAFLRKMKHTFPELTPGDLRLAAYLKMNLSTKEIAPLLGISIRGVENKRYRLRQKMNLPNDENLVEFLLEF